MASRIRLALLLSTRFFEDFYGDSLGISAADYIDSYRNDWSWDWCSVLREQGVDARIYVPSIRESGSRRTPEGFELRFLPLGATYMPYVRFPVLERTPVGRFAGQAVNTGAFLEPLRSALVSDDIDVLCVQEYWTARFDLLTRRLAVPIIAVDQGLPDRREVKVLKRGSFARASRIIVQTEREAIKVRALGGDAVVIPNAVDTDLFSPAARPDRSEHPCTVLSVARLHDAQKRPSDLIRALGLMPDEWSLDLVGTGPDEKKLRRLTQELGLEGRVRFNGFVGSKTDLRDFYRSAGVFALPSAYEGLPMALLEAMACGAAVVGSRIPAIARVLEPDGLLVEVGDVPALAASLREAASRRSELGGRARATIEERFSRHAIGPQLLECIRSTRVPEHPSG
jgi:glycosyltransferase involved in cell wall biosynthesis